VGQARLAEGKVRACDIMAARGGELGHGMVLRGTGMGREAAQDAPPDQKRLEILIQPRPE
jgi:hypothetical protein